MPPIPLGAPVAGGVQGKSQENNFIQPGLLQNKWAKWIGLALGIFLGVAVMKKVFRRKK